MSLLLSKLVRKTMDGGGEFKPCAFVDGLGNLHVVEKDCSQLEEDLGDPNSSFKIIKDAHTGDVVGIVVRGWERFDKSEI